MEDLSEYFKLETSCVQTFFLAQGTGFCIPVYQRPYSWDSHKITKLVSDISHGYASLKDNIKSATYLGAVITVTQVGNEIFGTKRSLPGNILSVIDGQQRISTLLLFIAALHEKISALYSKLHFEDSDKRLEETISEITNSTQNVLRKILCTDQSFFNPEGTAFFYPRIIRVNIDKWEPSGNCYHSPLALFLNKYNAHAVKLHSNPSALEEEYIFDLGTLIPVACEEKDNFKKVETAYNHLRSLLDVFEKAIENNKSESFDTEEIEVLDREAMVNKKDIQERLFRDEFDALATTSLGKDTEQAKLSLKLLQFLGLASYLLGRVALTKVETRADEYAFEIFEALNASGEPLTAIETFKPQVYRGQKLQGIKETDTYKWMEQVERNLEAEKTKAKNTRTNEVLIAFALIINGTKLSKHLNDQRQFLKVYDQLSESAKVDFVRDLFHLTEFFRHIWWDKEKSGLNSTCSGLSSSEKELLKLCFYFLYDIKHSITIGTLFHFYRLTRLFPSTETNRDFLEAVKACAAFSALWRGAKGGTDGIDDVYRSFCREGFKDDKGIQRLKPLSLLEKGFSYGQIAKVNELKAAMREKLRMEGIGDRNKWIETAKEVPIYNNSVVAKFILMFAANDTICSHDKLIRGKKGSVSVLDVETWIDATIEHIAPQTPDKDWTQKKYSEFYTPQGKHKLDGIGNLLLLPKDVNSSLKNNSWDLKKKIYTALAEKDPAEAAKIIETLHLSKKSVAALQSQQKYFVLAENIASPSYTDWLPSCAEARGETLLQLAYDNLIDFLT